MDKQQKFQKAQFKLLFGLFISNKWQKSFNNNFVEENQWYRMIISQKQHIEFYAP